MNQFLTEEDKKYLNDLFTQNVDVDNKQEALKTLDIVTDKWIIEPMKYNE